MVSGWSTIASTVDGNPHQQPDQVILGQEALLGGRVDAQIPEGESGSSGQELEKIGELGLCEMAESSAATLDTDAASAASAGHEPRSDSM